MTLDRLNFCKNILSCPLPKIHENRVTTRVGYIYMRENTTRIHAKPKVTWTSYKNLLR